MVQLALASVAAGVIAWRIPVIRADGAAVRESRQWVGRPLPRHLAALAGPSRIGSRAVIYYFYSEECPYCGMDHGKVRRASLNLAAGPAAFDGVVLGPSADEMGYWRSVEVPPPDTVVQLPVDVIDSLGVEGVPLLLLARGDTVLAAWIGHLVWQEGDIARAMNCRLGRTTDCARLYLADIARGLRRRLPSVTTAEPGP